MEDNKMKNHPSLPSNYVTLAHLQERWLKQQQQQINHNDNQIQQQQQQDEEKERHQTQKLQPQQNPHQQGEPAVVVRTRGPAPRFAAGNHRAKKQYRPKNRNDSVIHRRAIEAETGIGYQNADMDNKGNESKKKKKKKKVKQNPRVKEGKTKAESSEAKKTTIESELNEKKSGDSIVEEVEQKFEVTIESELKEKKSGDLIVEEVEQKLEATIESELKEKKSADSIIEEVEQKFGGLSMKSGNGKQNWRSKRVNDGFRRSQSQRKNYYEGRGYGYGHGHFGGGFRRHNYEEQKKRDEKMVWVRKDGSVGGEIETLSSNLYTDMI